MERNDAGSAVWFLAGAAVGAAIALLFAPHSGQETRRLISRKTNEGREALLDHGRELYEKSRDLADEAAEVFERGKKLAQG
jgi:gas vesicle protein